MSNKFKIFDKSLLLGITDNEYQKLQNKDKYEFCNNCGKYFRTEFIGNGVFDEDYNMCANCAYNLFFFIDPLKFKEITTELYLSLINDRNINNNVEDKCNDDSFDDESELDELLCFGIYDNKIIRVCI